MLVLGRHVDQRIIINDDLIIIVTDVCKNTGFVKLGFEANKLKYRIDRQEIHMKRLRGE